MANGIVNDIANDIANDVVNDINNFIPRNEWEIQPEISIQSRRW
jgi:hypothetical protein